jgi:hypothetical protein
VLTNTGVCAAEQQLVPWVQTALVTGSHCQAVFAALMRPRVQDDAFNSGPGSYGDVVAVSSALRENMVAEGKATNACFLSILSILSPLQLVRRLLTASLPGQVPGVAHLHGTTCELAHAAPVRDWCQMSSPHMRPVVVHSAAALMLSAHAHASATASARGCKCTGMPWRCALLHLPGAPPALAALPERQGTNKLAPKPVSPSQSPDCPGPQARMGVESCPFTSRNPERHY